MIVGIVGAEEAKFTPMTRHSAIRIISILLSRPGAVLTSGHCHLGGVDIWAEEIAKTLGAYDPNLIFPPKDLNWSTGFKPRNLKIARAADEIYCITLAQYPPEYIGMKFSGCYHCKSNEHVKSGGCWTMKQAERMGKTTGLFIV